MRRRALLASVGALTAGCLGYQPPQDNTSPTGTFSTETPPTPACESPTPADSEPAATPPPDAEYELTGLSTSTSTDRPSAKYVLEPSAFYSADAVGRKEERTGDKQIVVDISDVNPPDARGAIETAAREGVWKSESLPAGLAETIARVDFFTGLADGSTYTHVGLQLHRLSPNQPPAVEFEASTVDRYVAPDSPGVIAFTLRNRSSRPRGASSGTVPPFGMLHAESATGDDRFLLWRDYEEEGCFHRDNGSWIRCDIGKHTELQPCEDITRRYEILPSTTAKYPDETAPPKPNRYRVADSISYSSSAGALRRRSRSRPRSRSKGCNSSLSEAR